MSTIPVNAMLVEPGHVAFQIPEELVDGKWVSCAAYRFARDKDGHAYLEFADEDDLEAITSPGGAS